MLPLDEGKPKNFSIPNKFKKRGNKPGGTLFIWWKKKLLLNSKKN